MNKSKLKKRDKLDVISIKPNQLMITRKKWNQFE